MNRQVKALVVEDHPLMALATKNILEQIEGIEVVGTASSGKIAIELVELYQPDLVLLDYHLPDGFGSHVVEEVKSRFPSIHVVIFTGIDITDLYNHLLELGVSGIISKESSEMTIRNMVSCILDNHTMLPLPVYHQMRLNLANAAPEVNLTGDEVQIMSLIVSGATHDHIAEQIHASRRSIDNYVRKIYDKFGVKSRVQAIERFIKSRYYSE
ncbi:putative transcriptional regulatory protein NarL [compost metagenome]